MAVYYWGSSGNKVAEIQQKLKTLGYYADNIDGVFGANTYYAVVDFQNTNILSADGIVGNETLNKLGISIHQASQSDLETLALEIYREGRGEPYTGQVAIGAVILNRVAHKDFPDTIEGVVHQYRDLYSLRYRGTDLIPNETAYHAAIDALNGWDPTGGALYFWRPETTTSKWIWSIPVKTRICGYLFG